MLMQCPHCKNLIRKELLREMKSDKETQEEIRDFIWLQKSTKIKRRKIDWNKRYTFIGFMCWFMIGILMLIAIVLRYMYGM